MSAIPETREGIKEWCREAFFEGRNNGGDSSPRDLDYQEIYDSSIRAFEAWWERRSRKDYQEIYDSSIRAFEAWWERRSRNRRPAKQRGRCP